MFNPTDKKQKHIKNQTDTRGYLEYNKDKPERLQVTQLNDLYTQAVHSS